MKEVTLIDSPYANVANIARALRASGATLRVTADAAEVAEASRIVLPGVGSFAAARRWLHDHAIDDALRRSLFCGGSLLGICVGHQLLFDVSFEMGETAGLALLRGEVRMLDGPLPVPQIGWNRVASEPDNPLFENVAPNTPFYFVNSYAVTNAFDEVAHADYGGSFTAAVQSDRVFGVQFHPEKSSAAGLQLLRNFIAWN